MRGCHVESAVFDDPNLVSCGGLAPVVASGQRCGLAALVGAHLTLPDRGGANASLKVLALVGGMVFGADSIADMDVLRHGGMPRLFAGVRAPSTLGTFLRTFTFGHVRHLDAVAARMLARLATVSPVLPGADVLAFVDVDDTVKATYGYAKQGAGYGYTVLKGLNALIATVSSPLAAPLIVATRLRKGSANSARGAARLVADTVRTTRAAGAGSRDGTGLIVLRADSAFYGYPVIAAARRAGAHVLRHRPGQPDRHPSDREHRRERLAADPLPQRGLGRPSPGSGQRRRDHPSPVHRVHRPPQGRADSRPAPGPPGPTPHHRHQHGQRHRHRHRCAAGRVVRRLPLPRGLHREPAHPGPGPETPPRPRDHRAGPRRPALRSAGPPAVRGRSRRAVPGCSWPRSRST